MRRLAAVTATAVVLLATSVPAAYAAAPATPATFTELAAAVSDCSNSVVELAGDIAGGVLTVSCSLTLDLNGHTLDTTGVEVTGTNTLTINDNVGDGELIANSASRAYAAGIEIPDGASLVVQDGNITATGGVNGAGIGGGRYEDAGSVTAAGGAVVATGGGHGAGIGGGYLGDGGTVTIYGGAVTGIGGSGSAGIGGGGGETPGGGDGGTVTILGGTVIGTGGIFGAGIGGAYFGGGGDVSIGIGADVTASSTTSGNTVSAVGAGLGGSTFGSLLVAGDLYIARGALIVPNSATGAEVTVEATGRILGPIATPTTGATIAGAGQIDNGGVIALASSRVNTTVTDHNYVVTFDNQDDAVANPADVRVFATSFDTGFRDFPTPPADAVWASESDGSGKVVTDRTTLTGDMDLFAVTGFEALASQAASCIDGDTVVVPGDLSGGSITVNCDLTIDLNGHTLETEGVELTGTNTLTMDDTVGSGKLIADASTIDGRPGINVPAPAALTINGGTVVATGGAGGPGIGSTFFLPVGSITITGGVVTAVGDQDSAGIGSAREGAGGEVIIGAGAIVTASGGSTAIGAGAASPTFGSLRVDGTLHVPSGDLVILDSAAGDEVTIGATGEILGVVGDETTGANISGAGQIDNGGVIALDVSLVTATVSDHNYLITFDTQGGTDPTPVRVFANSFDAGYRTLPVAPAGTNWNTAADGSGQWLDADSKLSADTTVFVAQDVALTITPSADHVDQGDSLTFTVSGTNHSGDAIATTGATLTSDVATDVITGLTVTFPHASPHQITASFAGITATVLVEVTPAAAVEPAEPDDVEATEPVEDSPAVPGDELAGTGPDVNVGGALGWATLLVLAGLGITLVRRTRRAGVR